MHPNHRRLLSVALWSAAIHVQLCVSFGVRVVAVHVSSGDMLHVQTDRHETIGPHDVQPWAIQSDPPEVPLGSAAGERCFPKDALAFSDNRPIIHSIKGR